MTPLEFKSWFNGFTEALTGTPTKAQWARIKERVDEIDGKAVTEKVFVDRYWPYQYPYYAYYQQPYRHSGLGVSTTSNTLSSANASSGVAYSQLQCGSAQGQSGVQQFNGLLALYAAGKNEAEQFQQ